MGPEARLEAWCVKRAAGAGWAAVKLFAAPGWPDRLFFGPFGRIVIMEFKAPRGRLRKLQRYVIEWLRLHEHPVHIVTSKDQFEELLGEALDAAPIMRTGRPPLAPYHGATATCAHCGKVFVLTMHQRSDLRRGVDRPQFCGGACQRGAQGAANGKKSAVKISRTRRAQATPKPKTYRKLHGRHEHRVVAEQMLGRALRPGEIVHHKDGNAHNNHPDNLQILASQSEHVKLHRKTK